MIDFTVARDKLTQFETADELADFLISEGIKGTRRSVTSCPIAVWLSSQIEWFVVADNKYTMPFNRGEAHDNTEAMEDFIYNFDTGRYPTLDKEFRLWRKVEEEHS